jgi:RNA polymerase sigma-70 factor (ECF subfamily)
VLEPDPALVASARRGDADAFGRLVRRFQGDVWRLAYGLIGCEASADDVAQDAFVRAYRFLPRYRGDSKFSTWLFSITRNCALDELRRSGRRRRLSERLEPPTAQAPDAGLRLEILEALACLPLELREPIVLIDMFGLSYAEVAGVVGAPVGTIKSRVHRGRAQLAHALGPPEETQRRMAAAGLQGARRVASTGRHSSPRTAAPRSQRDV